MEGISNLGGTCAINSIIQIFCRCHKLRNAILQSKPPPLSFTDELKEILELIHIHHKSLHPSKFLNCFYKTFENIFHRFEQIDINELWFYIYDKIHNDLSQSISISIENQNIPHRDIYEEHNNQMIKFNDYKCSPINELTQGSYINIIICSNCDNKSYSFEPFTSILIDIDINENNNSVVDLLINTFKEEIRDADDWKCDKCNNKCSYKKLRRIWKLPELLFITLNRFKDCYKKNSREVYINDGINFNSGSILSSTNEYKYKLNSVALHQGNLSGGHYTALCNINDDIYHLYNDEHVSTFNKDDIPKIASYAYMILYELIS